MLALTQALRAQTTQPPAFAVTLGGYFPTAYLPLGIHTLLCYDPSETGQCADYWRKANRAVAIGTRVTEWVSNRYGFEGAAWFSPSSVTYSPPSYPSKNTSAGWILLGSFRLAINPSPRAVSVSGILLAGPALAYRSMTYDGQLSLGGALGVGLDIRPRGPFRFRIQVDDYLYSASQSGDLRLQQDAVMSISIGRNGGRLAGKAAQ